MPRAIKMEEDDPEPPAIPSFANLSRRRRTSSEGDGAVVREIDVYLSNEMARQFRLIQYPLQQATASQMPISGARLKPRHNILQIDQEMPALPRRHYSPLEQNFSSLTTRTFQSETVPVETHLCLGKIWQHEESGESAMYLVPVQCISQMRPTMSHIYGDVVEDGKDDNDGGTAMEEDKETKMASLKPLAYQRKESERAAELRKSSYSYKKKSEAAEEWEALEVVDEDSEQVLGTIEKVFHPKLKDPEEGTATAVPPDKKVKRSTAPPQVAYVESLNYMPPSSSDALSIQVNPQDPKTIVAKLTVLLRKGLPTPFSVLRMQLPPTVTDSQVFDALAVCAILVRGNFCLHSRFVALPKELQHARTFMLSLLQNNGLIRRQMLEKVYESDNRVSSDKLYTLLQLVAKKTQKGWILRVDDDLSFVADHPEQAELFQRYWDKVFASRKQKDLLQQYNTALADGEA